MEVIKNVMRNIKRMNYELEKRYYNKSIS